MNQNNQPREGSAVRLFFGPGNPLNGLAVVYLVCRPDVALSGVQQPAPATYWLMHETGAEVELPGAQIGRAQYLGQTGLNARSCGAAARDYQELNPRPARAYFRAAMNDARRLA